VYPQIDRSAVI